jgi:hypothetical protein
MRKPAPPEASSPLGLVIESMASSAMISRGPRPESSAPRKQRRRGRNGWPLAEADKSAGIPEADRRAIKSAIAEWGGRAKSPRPPGK